MDLKNYLDNLPRGGVSSFAGALDISSVYLFQLAARQNKREPSPELCVRIEKATFGQVMRWDLRPTDWNRIWPELMTVPGAPAVPQEPAAAEQGA